MAEITTKGGDKDYAPKIKGLIKAIKANAVGGVIVGAIESSSKQLTIMPESERPAGSFDPNLTYTGSVAAAFPVDSAGKPDYAGAAPAGLSREGKDRDKWYHGRGDNEETEDIDERYNPAPEKWGKARGSGSHAVIFFYGGKLS